jgi:two-component system, chemotaxis family, chemotaxis protein CheY
MFFNRTAMVCDDHSADREQLREILRFSGCTVIANARNTDDTLARFEKFDPDIVIIDVNLLGTLDALVAIQRMWRLKPETTILATGTASQSASVMEALTMGASDFMLKPFQQRAVRNCLERNL